LAFGEKMGRTKGFEWFSTFKSNLTSVEDADNSEYPSINKADRNVD
jgi:hypothetical protein